MALSSSFLGLEGLHVFITGAAGGIGSRAVQEFLGRYKYMKTQVRLMTSSQPLFLQTYY